jgi:hypothetical protein
MDLKQFEDDMLNLVQNIEFFHKSNTFQEQLNKDKKTTKEGDKLLVSADKTTHFYKVDPDNYDRLLNTNITKDYKKAATTLENTIRKGDKKIATELGLDDRINKTSKNQAFITLKDHKPNFNNNPTCRLINPTKSEIGKISKQILEKVNNAIRNATRLNQWKNTKEVIRWFCDINNKQTYSFICFDVCEFYPSITEELLLKALEYAATYCTISQQDKNIIVNAKKSLLYDKNVPWTKKGASVFDVTMGSFDRAETCELVGLFILSQLQHLNINIGLYKDDGLSVSDKTPRQIENIKKNMQYI